MIRKANGIALAAAAFGLLVPPAWGGEKTLGHRPIPGEMDSIGGDVSAANYAKIKTGMSLRDVEKILGKGEELSSSGEDSYIMVWQDGFKTISVFFIKNKVVSKSKVGL